MPPTADRPTETSYDQVPYPSLSYAQTHPDRLATVATLLGMDPPPVTGCRVLEMGCASGGNLIPMAYGLPGSEFVGIDLAARQIAQGQEMIDALGLTNVTLRHMDILDVAPPSAASSLGQFDYVIAHGVYSWVPAAVREKLLSVCRENLAPDGVAYVSYNTYPGWHMLNIVRDMMRYHTRDVEDPHERAAQARDMLDFLVQATAGTDGAAGSGAHSVAMSAYASFIQMYARFLSGELEGRRRPKIDSLLLHDELETHNEPVYFHQFARQAAAHGLQYLAEAEFHSMVDSNFPPQVSERLCEMAHDVIELEQYLDFLRNRSLRQTLLCHADVSFSRKIKPERLQRLYVSSQAEPVPVDEKANTPNGIVKFEGSDSAAIATDHPVTKAAMRYLYDIWPQAVSFDQALSEARARLAARGGTANETSGERARSIDAQILGANLLKAYSYSGTLVRFHTYDPPLTLTVGEHPQASPLARLQARDSHIVTNLRHERVTLDAFNRYLLRHLDGQHDREALLQAFLDGPVADGVLKIQQEGQPVESPPEVRQLLTEALERNLHGLARTALLLE